MLKELARSALGPFSFRRRLPPGFGDNSIWLSPRTGFGFLLRPWRKIDPTLFRLVKEFVREGNVVWDIGAFIGLFTFTSAHLAGPRGLVVAVEADTGLVQTLRRSAAIQSPSSAPVSVIPAAIAESVGIRAFEVVTTSRSLSHLEGYGVPGKARPAENQTVIAVSLDWLAERCPAPDVLEIDVEGAELLVLQGARTILEKKRPILVCEVGAATSEEASKLLLDCGYRIQDGMLPPAERRDLHLAPWVTVAIPT